MICSKCGSEIPEGIEACPNCGLLPGDGQAPADTDTEAAECAEGMDIAQSSVPEAPDAASPPVKRNGGAKAAAGAILLFAVVVVVAVAAWLLTRSPASSDLASNDVVVAEVGDYKLGNNQFNFYYWNEYSYVLSYYGDYISMYLDLQTPLDQQMYDETVTWQQHLTDSAKTSFEQTMAPVLQARESGQGVSEQVQTKLDEALSNLESVSDAAGFESVDEYLENTYGAGAELESFRKYLENSLVASEYFEANYASYSYSDEQLSEYYDQNAEYFQYYGVTKDDRPMAAVRHILISPETDANGVSSEEEWAQALDRAEALLSQWREGEATEASFAALAAENTADTASASTGGLYENVYPGQTVESFENWTLDSSRQPGDTDVVETTYGYHIMYFVEGSDVVYWKYVTDQEIRYEDFVNWVENLVASYEFTYYDENIALWIMPQDDGEAPPAE